ncbi:MAG TPA: polysaccharide biosynthesis/export family protein [Verrucomicrobiae bacterium]|nr:polysaccharide biosynthesis/export family protein [Verrucomicrobiae bacterium]
MRAAGAVVLALCAFSGCQTTRSGSSLDEALGVGAASLADEPRTPHFANAEVDRDGTVYYSPGAGGGGGAAAEPAARGRADAGRGGRPQQAFSASAGAGDGGSASVLRVGDYVQVQLKGVPAPEEASLDFSLNEQGTIAMPHLPPIRALGKSTGALEREIEEMYKAQRIFTDPKVSVLVGGRYINVMGEVRMPQRVLYTSDLTMLKAIAAAGGFTDYANKRAVRVHRGNEVVEVHAGRALKEPSQDLPLKPGDTVEVKRSIF